MVKGLKMKVFNSHLNRSTARVRSFPGATIRQLKHYILPTLVDDKPNSVIIHGGCNDVQDENVTAKKIAEDLVEVAIMCKSYGVKEVIISSLICRKNDELNKKVNEINANLVRLCRENSLLFNNNNNIKKNHLWKDGLHLSNSGKNILARNFINFFNSIHF